MTGVPIWAVLLIGLATGAATLAGGILILSVNSALDLVLGFSAGAVIGVALFDLLPEALDLTGSRNPLTVTAALAVGFAIYLAVDRIFALVAERRKRHLAPASLTLHSFVDGLAIGLSFHVSPAAGVIVAVGVLAHDFIDGANTVVVSVSGGSGRDAAKVWLVADAVAPVAGILLSGTFAIPTCSLAMLLAVFAGLFLYVGASELLPRSQARRPRLSTVAATTAGLALVYALITLLTTKAIALG